MNTDTLGDTVEGIDAEIRGLEARICRLRTRRNALVMPSGLPADIIVSILLQLQSLIYSKLDLDRSDVGKQSGCFTWIQSTHICSQWWRVASDTPSIWACLEINARPSLPWMQCSLSRAGRAPLSLHVMIVSRDNGPSGVIAQYLIDHQCLERIEELTIHSNSFDIGDLNPSRSVILDRSWHDTLTLILKHGLKSLLYLASNRPADIVGALFPPSLREMVLHQVFVGSKMNTKEMPIMDHLTSVELRRKHDAISPEEILNLLHCTKLLRRIQISCGDGELAELAGNTLQWPTLVGDEFVNTSESLHTEAITAMKRFIAVPKHISLVHLRELSIDSSLTFLIMMLLVVPIQQLDHLTIITRARRNIWIFDDDQSNFLAVQSLYHFLFGQLHTFWVTSSEEVLPEAELRIKKNESRITFRAKRFSRNLSFCITSPAAYDHYSDARLDPLIGSIRTWIFDPVKQGGWRDPIQGGVGDAQSNISKLVVDFSHSRFSYQQVEEVWKYLKFRARGGAKCLKILRLFLPGGVNTIHGRADRHKAQSATREAIANNLVKKIVWMTDTGAILTL